MREIKFRAWDKKAGQIYFTEPDFILALKLDGRIWETNVHNGHISDRTDDFDLQLFTGLKDKNGKEIYEGDIYHVTNRTDGEPAVLRNFVQDTYWLQMWMHEGEKFEVIGNIYENPELLK